MKNARFETVGLTAAAMLFTAVPMVAQDVLTGTSKPEDVVMSSTPDPVAPAVAPAPATLPATKPSAAVEYLPYTQTGGNPAAVAGDTTGRRPLTPSDPDAGIVTYVPSPAGEIPDGTVVKAKLRETLSTISTRAGSRFSAEVSEPVMRDGQVVVPAGSVLAGRVTWLRSGKRISGGAAIHLEAQTVTLPDGSQYVLHARVIDTSSWDNTRVDSEGTISRKESKKKTAAAMGLATGGGAAAGAMIGGVPGALIGAGVGAGLGTIVWLKEDKQAELPKDLGLVFSLTLPMAVTPARATGHAGVVGTPGGE